MQQDPLCKVQVSSSHYSRGYLTRRRYHSLIEQVVETLRLEPQSAVEVGVGTGFVTRELRSAGVSVIGVDIDPALHPDVVGSVLELPLATGCADVSLCFEVLEHLPFESFSRALKELARVSRRWVYISIPDARRSFQVGLGRGFEPGWLRLVIGAVHLWPRRIRRGGETQFEFSSGIPLRCPAPHLFDGQHYWELGKKETPEERVLDHIAMSGLRLVRHYRLWLNPYHHFFLLEKV